MEEVESQAPVEQSIEDSMADVLFGKEQEEEFDYEPAENAQAEGDDETEEVEESEKRASEEEPETKYVTVTMDDGSEVEIAEEFKDYFMRSSDYTQKTQELATQRKEVEVHAELARQAQSQQEFAASVQNELLEVYQAQQNEAQYREFLKNNIDELSSHDIEKIRIQIDELRHLQQTKSQELASKWQEHQQAAEQSRKELRDKSTEILKGKVQGWNEQHETELKNYALSLGIPEQAYLSVVDPLEKLILYKASQFDKLQEKTGEAVAKVKSAPTIKPKGHNPMPKEVGDKLNLRKKLKSDKISTADKANLIGGSIRLFGS